MDSLTVFDRFALHGATWEEEFDRVQAKLPKDATPAEMISRYQAEIMFAKRVLTGWKSEFSKSQRPPHYSAKKELIETLREEIIYWQQEAGLSASLVEVVTDTPSSKPIGASNSLSLRQLALVCQYNGTLVSKGEVANALAKSVGYNSGERLYKHYNNLRCPTDRVGVEGKEVGPRIRDIEAALPHLTGLHLQQAKNELDTIRPRK